MKYKQDRTGNALPSLISGTRIQHENGDYVLEDSEYQRIRSFPKIGPQNGTLLLIGGGKIGSEIYNFLRLKTTNESKLGVISTANCREDIINTDNMSWNELKLNKFRIETVTHTRDPAIANNDEFGMGLFKSDAIWIAGGGAECLVSPYLHSKFHQKLLEYIHQGGIIAGTSAGAVAMGSYFQTLHGMPRIGRLEFEGFGFLKNTTIATHIDRYTNSFQEDIIDVVDHHYPGLLGIGIEENTAITVTGDIFEVVGKGIAVTYDGQSINEFSKGMKYNLASRKAM